MPGATTTLTAKTWAESLIDDNTGHMWIPAVHLSVGAPDYLINLCHDAHVEDIGEQDDYTMWFVKQSLLWLQKEQYIIEPYPVVPGVSELKYKPPQMWQTRHPLINDGIMDYITDPKARNAVMAEWLNADIHRFSFADRVMKDIHLSGEFINTSAKMSLVLEHAMNLELHTVFTKCVEAVNAYLKLVNREGF